MKIALVILIQIVVVVLLADFAAGFVHWLEDAYVHEDTPVVGGIVARPNIVHHHYPRYMTRHGWLKTSWDLVLISVALLAAAACLGCLTWQVWLFAILSANANEFHKWEHRTRKENGPVISFLQDIHILQNARHHARHHTDPKNSHYCTMTLVLNPMLDGMNFWNGAECILEKTLGWKRREDTSLRGHGPGPRWLSEYRPNSA
jgi:hypothetical protein